MMKEKISIIIPVYNTAKYVGKCIDSVLNQSYTNKEIVLVNDGSNDGSQKILEKYQKRFPNMIKVINKNNEGVDFARRTGLDNITGELVMFVDSDDMLEENAIDKLYTTLIENDVDMVSSEFNRFFSFYKRPSPLLSAALPFYERKIAHEKMMNDLYISFFGISIMTVSLCGKLYKASLFENWQPSGLRFGEDLTTNMKIFPNIQSMYMLKDRLYNYRVGGITGHYMKFFMIHCKALYKIKKDELIKNEYQKGFVPIAWELKNELQWHINQVILYQKEKDSKWLSKELEDSIYDDFDKLLFDGYKPKKEIDKAIYYRDAEKAWELMKASFNPYSPKNIIKRLVSKL